MAVLGLALSGNSEARAALENLQRKPTTDSQKRFSAQVSGTITAALRDHDEIARDGLTAYYRKRRQ